MAKVHEQDHEEVDDSPDDPEPHMENHFHEESISMKNPTLCKTLRLRVFWKLTHHTLLTWHPHTISLNTLLPLMDL